MKYIIPTTTAIIGALSLITTGCHPYNQPTAGMMAAPVTSGMAEGDGFTISKIMVSSSKAQSAFKRARDYYAQLPEKERVKMEKRKVYYLAVEVPGYRNRGTGIPVLLYDTRANRLINHRVIFIATPLKPRQILMAPREVSSTPGYRYQYLEYAGPGAPIAYP
ncbi:MAG: hypothetical protein C5B47_06315 [Verrucomicrobia bacterium]|nr:MAG: hypothetical protein C5B47_06315 [Verrucomicrobiota bacterium]